VRRRRIDKKKVVSVVLIAILLFSVLVAMASFFVR
jgi:hypothetical protein